MLLLVLFEVFSFSPYLLRWVTAGTEAVPKSGKDVSGGDALQKEKDVFDQGIAGFYILRKHSLAASCS